MSWIELLFAHFLKGDRAAIEAARAEIAAGSPVTIEGREFVPNLDVVDRLLAGVGTQSYRVAYLGDEP